MPLIVNSKTEFPIYKELVNEQVFIIDQSRAETQDIRPLRIALLNLMPATSRVNTEIQFFKLLGNTPLQIEPILLKFNKFQPNTGAKRFEQFYKPLSNVQEQGLDGLIITGANLEIDVENNSLLDFENIKYYQELIDLMNWASKNVTSTIYSCLASHIALNCFFGLERTLASEKIFGIFDHQKTARNFKDLTRDMNDIVFAPHSRWGDIKSEKLKATGKIDVIYESPEAGWLISLARKGREIFIQGHPEYDRNDLVGEYLRDKKQGQKIPYNYFPNNDETQEPICNWRADSAVFYRNWVNYVYQTTNFDLAKPVSI